MRTLWNAISFLAVVNLFILILFVTWLVHSDRLSMDRLYAVREMLARTITQEHADARARERAEGEQALEEIEQIRRERPLPPSAQRVGYVLRLEQSERDLLRRNEAEAQHLRQLLDRMRDEVIAARREFDAERSQWERERDTLAQRENDVQFRAVVQLLENVPSKQAKGMLVELMRDDRVETAVAYLNAMKPFNAARVLREFKTDEEQRLATELLERMKTLGSAAPAGTGVAGIALDADSDLPPG